MYQFQANSPAFAHATSGTPPKGEARRYFKPASPHVGTTRNCSMTLGGICVFQASRATRRAHDAAAETRLQAICPLLQGRASFRRLQVASHRPLRRPSQHETNRTHRGKCLVVSSQRPRTGRRNSLFSTEGARALRFKPAAPHKPSQPRRYVCEAYLVWFQATGHCTAEATTCSSWAKIPHVLFQADLPRTGQHNKKPSGTARRRWILGQWLQPGRCTHRRG